jgi:PD-(D/E)XK endonuclease
MCSLPTPGPLTRHPVDVGQRSEAAIIAELVKRGYRVLTPYGVNHRYDLVIDAGGRFLRAQCKTGAAPGWRHQIRDSEHSGQPAPGVHQPV